MSTRGRLASFLFIAVALASCRETSDAPTFPKAHRPVAPIVGDSFSTEDARDRVGEAEAVIRLAEVQPGMSVADIGAGAGYYTVRLSPVVGRRGRVLAEDIVQTVVNRLAMRVQKEGLSNVAVRLGEPDDPELPPNSFDRVFLVHMYHEVESPYAFLWRLRNGLKPDGKVIVVDSYRPAHRHGMPPDLLRCEFKTVGLELDQFQPLSGGETYFAAFRPVGDRPDPSAMKACALKV